jgi:3-hydroxypropanoate dehydrogenase
MSVKQPLSQEALDQLFRNARSYNGYLSIPVREEHLRSIWDLMKMGPTSVNMLPARVVWCVSEKSKETLAHLSSGSNRSKIRAAPVTAIIGMDIDFHVHLPELFPHNPAVRDYFSDGKARETTALRNSSLQGAYFIMAARALGLDTGPISGFDNAAVDDAFFAGTSSVRSNFISTLGYGDPKTIFERSPRPEFGKFNRIA